MHNVSSRSRWQTLLSSLLLGSALFAATWPAVAVDAAQGAGAQGAAQASGAGDAQADASLDWKAGPQRVGSLEVELVSDSRQVMPGETFRIGMRLRHDPHWHTYWRNPGDTGYPTRFEIEGPADTQYSDIRWPAPERLAIGPLANYGYEGEALIYRDVTLPDSFKGRQARFRVKAEWLICKEVCIPGEAALQLDVPVGGVTEPDRAETASFEAARRGAPVPDQEPAAVGWWQRGGQAVVVLPDAITQGKAPRSALFLPYFSGVVKPVAPQKLIEISGEEGRYGLALELDEQGVRSADPGWEKEGGIVVIDDGQPVEVSLQRQTVVPVAARTVAINEPIKVDLTEPGAAQGNGGGKKGGLLGQLQLGGAPAQDVPAAGAMASGANGQGADAAAAGAASGAQNGASGAPGAAGSDSAAPAAQAGQDGGGLSAQAEQAVDQAQNTLGALTGTHGQGEWLALAGAILGAFIGGLILNLMPCVFPVIGLKILSFTEAAAGKPAQARRHAMVFGLGVVVSFLVLAAILLGLRALGQAAGWGFQLQSPVFVAVLALLFVVIGLNLFGVFEAGTRLTQLGAAGQGSHQGYWGSFMTGVMAVVVATPCTAPFMGGAVGFTLSSSPLLVLVVFATIGVGMALPYLVLASSERLLAMLPRPGAWLQTFKQLLAFPMFITAAWLVWVLALQSDAEGVLLLLLAAIFLSFSCWIYGRWQFELRPRSARSTPAWIITALLSLVVCGVLVSRLPVVAEAAQTQAAPVSANAATNGPVSMLPPSCKPEADGRLPASCRGWQPWSPERQAAARAAGVPVFVDFSAAWCLSCQVNEKVALNRDEVQAAFRDRNVLLLKADWTRRDPAISAELARFGRNSVPLYLFYDGRDPKAAPVQLPELLTVDTVLKAIGAAK